MVGEHLRDKPFRILIEMGIHSHYHVLHGSTKGGYNWVCDQGFSDVKVSVEYVASACIMSGIAQRLVSTMNGLNFSYKDEPSCHIFHCDNNSNHRKQRGKI